MAALGFRGGVAGWRLSSGCGRSLWRGELTLTATKPPVSQMAGEAVNISEAMCSGHLRCGLVGPARTTGPRQASRLDSTQSGPTAPSSQAARRGQPCEAPCTTPPTGTGLAVRCPTRGPQLWGGGVASNATLCEDQFCKEAI